jgi:hypothetical protein
MVLLMIVAVSAAATTKRRNSTRTSTSTANRTRFLTHLGMAHSPKEGHGGNTYMQGFGAFEMKCC